jgi:hypothetical protein
MPPGAAEFEGEEAMDTDADGADLTALPQLDARAHRPRDWAAPPRERAHLLFEHLTRYFARNGPHHYKPKFSPRGRTVPPPGLVKTALALARVMEGSGARPPGA